MDNWIDIIDNLIKYDENQPGIMWATYNLLEDLENEIDGMCRSSSDPMIAGTGQIIHEKIERRLTYLAKQYLACNNT